MTEIKEMLSSGIRNFICRSMPGKTVRSGEAVQLSKHAMLELFFVIRGESRFQMDDKVYDIRPGNMCVIEPWVIHASGFYPDDHDLFQIWLHLGRDQLRVHFIQVEKQGHFRMSMAPMIFPYSISAMLRNRWHLAKENGDITPDSLNKYLRTPLTFILEEILLKLEHRQKKSENSNIDIVESIKQYIINKQGARCSLDKLEEFTGYSKFYISHLFKEETGLSIGRYINDIRVKYTAEAVLCGIPYKEIASQLGFSSVQAFSPWNKKNKKQIDEFKKWIQKKDEKTDRT